ncbi:hypothetical protein FRC09_009060 [Ceratobasidium sp. 395]|nr:hypothetical protein FRC09_009060 [Ceratobasidium sp. 395]
MSHPDYIGFECDYSDHGTLSVTLESHVKDKRKLENHPNLHIGDNEPLFEEVTVLVPLWLPLKLNDKREEEVVKGKRFIEVFIEAEELQRRVPKRWPTQEAVYEADWMYAENNNGALPCIAYDDNGFVLGTEEAQAWPRLGLVAPRQATGVGRYYAQAAIWEHIITTSASSNSNRLWKPTSWTQDPIRVYFSPCSAWPSFAELKTVCDHIREEAAKKSEDNSRRRLSIVHWLAWDVVAPGVETKDLILLSTNLLRMYNTYISKEDLWRLAEAQTQGANDWVRPWPSQADAEKVQDEMLKSLENTNPEYHKLLGRGLKKSITTWISSSKLFGVRIDANKIMGSKSANRLGKYWWNTGDVPNVVAEWTHRTAYSLGPLENQAGFQTPENIVFGTLEANSDISRAEMVIRVLRDVSEAHGILNNTVINSNLPEGHQDRITRLNITTDMATTRAQRRALGAAAPGLDALSDRPASMTSRYRRVTMVEVPDHDSPGYRREGSADLEIPGSFAASPVVHVGFGSEDDGFDSDELDERLAAAHISTVAERTDDESCPPGESTAGEPAYPQERTGASPYPTYSDGPAYGQPEYPNSDVTFGRTSTPRSGTGESLHETSTTPFQTPSRKAKVYAKTPSVKLNGARFFGNSVINIDTCEDDTHENVTHAEPEVEQKSDDVRKNLPFH